MQYAVYSSVVQFLTGEPNDYRTNITRTVGSSLPQPTVLTNNSVPATSVTALDYRSCVTSGGAQEIPCECQAHHPPLAGVHRVLLYSDIRLNSCLRELVMGRTNLGCNVSAQFCGVFVMC